MKATEKQDFLTKFINITDEYRLSDNQTEESFKEMMKKISDCWSFLIKTKGLADYTDFLCDKHIKKQMGYLYRFHANETFRWNPVRSKHFPYMHPEVYSQPTDTI